MTDPKLQTTADLAQQIRDVIPPAPHFLAMLEELELRASCAPPREGPTVWVALQCPESSPEIQIMDCLAQVMDHFEDERTERAVNHRVAQWFADRFAGLECRDPYR